MSYLKSRIGAACLLCLLAAAALPATPRATQFSPGTAHAHEPSLAVWGERLAAAWHGGSRGSAIHLRRFDAAAKPLRKSVQLTDGRSEALEPDIQWLGEDLVVAWYEKSLDGGATVWLARFGQDGQPRWRHALSSELDDGRSPVVRVHADQIWVAWIQAARQQPPALWTARLAADGATLRSPRQHGEVGADTWNLNAAVDAAGAFHVVFDARAGTRANELQLLVDHGESTARYRLSSDDGYASTFPDVALSGNRVALTWFDVRDGNAEVYLFVGELAALHAPVDAAALRVTRTSGDSIGAYVAWNGDRIGLAWCDNSTGQYEIFSQLFDARGRSSAAARRITRNPTESSIPAIKPWRRGFVLAWTEHVVTTTDGRLAVVSSRAMLTTLR